MASRAVVSQQARGDGVVGGGKMQNKNAADGRNRRALGDIGNIASLPGIEAGKPQPQINRPVTRSFRAQLLANAQAAEKKPINVDKAPVLGGKQKLAAVRAVQKKPPLDNKPKKPSEATVTVPAPVMKPVAQTKNNQKEVSPIKKQNKEAASSSKKKTTYTSTLTARSKVACGLSNKPKKQIEDIDAADANNDLAAVEYVEDMYKFYKEVENESRPQMYMPRQSEINERMRSILIDWLTEVHLKFELSPETLYLTFNITDRFLSAKTVPRRELQLLGISAMLIASKYEEIWPPQVNDLVYIADNTYSHAQILAMEKTILGTLEWYMTVPTHYVFLARFIKASNPDPDMENMVNFVAELGVMHYDTLMYCPSMVAASAVYTARCSLNKTPAWNDTLEFHTGYSESQLMECAKLLALLHEKAAQSKLRAIYKKYSKPERGAVALVSPAKCLLSAGRPVSG